MNVLRLSILILCLLPGWSGADDGLWDQIRQGGYVLLIRHAQTTPGVGDPQGFRLGDCATQRNLSEAGRVQAARLGESLRAQTVPIAEIRSSRWCRCLETARLAFGRADPSRVGQMKRAVAQLAATLQPPRNVVLVTHGTNIAALLDVHPAPGEVVVARFRGDRLEVVGTIAAPQE